MTSPWQAHYLPSVMPLIIAGLSTRYRRAGTECGLLVSTSRKGGSSANQPAPTQRPLPAVRTVAKGGEFSNERTAPWQVARFWSTTVPR